MLYCRCYLCFVCCGCFPCCVPSISFPLCALEIPAWEIVPVCQAINCVQKISTSKSRYDEVIAVSIRISPLPFVVASAVRTASTTTKEYNNQTFVTQSFAKMGQRTIIEGIGRLGGACLHYWGKIEPSIPLESNRKDCPRGAYLL